MFQEFLRERIVDKMLVFIAPIIVGTGLSAFSSEQNVPRQTRFRSTAHWNIDGDTLLELYLH